MRSILSTYLHPQNRKKRVGSFEYFIQRSLTNSSLIKKLIQKGEFNYNFYQIDVCSNFQKLSPFNEKKLNVIKFGLKEDVEKGRKVIVTFYGWSIIISF